MKGFLSVIKPPGMTSFDVIRLIKKKKKKLKIGHTGTLDPGAAGVLPLCLGKATSVAGYLVNTVKRYRGEITLGIITDTLDGEGEILQRQTVSAPPEETVREVFNSLTGVIYQKPPAYSAVKYRGRPLYEYARSGEGKNVEVPEREVEVYSWKLEEVITTEDYPRIFFELECSPGTYVRSLALQAGEMLGCGAYLSFLLREKTGVFNLENSHTLEQVQETHQGLGSFEELLYPMDYGLSHLPRVVVKDEALKMIYHGNQVDRSRVVSDYIPGKEELEQEPGAFRIHDREGELWAVGSWLKTGESLKLKPDKVLAQELPGAEGKA